MSTWMSHVFLSTQRQWFPTELENIDFFNINYFLNIDLFAPFLFFIEYFKYILNKNEQS